MRAGGLDTSPRLGAGADDVYAALIGAHDGLSEADSARLNARLVLLLANQVGNAQVVIAAIEKARAGVGGPSSGKEAGATGC